MCIRILKFVSLLVSCAVVLSTAAVADEAKAPKSAVSERQAKRDGRRAKQPLVTIGKDTTVLTEPLDEEGYVDYVDYVNALMSKGVTPENNAAVLLWQVYGPKAIDEEHREAYFKRLGIKPLPDEGDYFRDVKRFADEEKLDELQQQLDAALTRPWTKDEFPAVMQWLDANGHHLTNVANASKRPRMYLPYVRESGVGPLTMPHVGPSRGIVKAFAARAMLRAGEGHIAAAERDLLTLHRLAALHDQGMELRDVIVKFTIDRIALVADAALVNSGKLSAQQARQLQSRIATLPPLSPIRDRIDKTERYLFIDAVVFIARNPQEADGLADSEDVRPTIDWNQVLRFGNDQYDRLAAALAQPTHALQKKELSRVRGELMAVIDRATKGKGPLALLHSSQGVIAVTMDTDTAHHTLRQLVVTSCALAAYKKDRGKYPDNLTELTPDYLSELPHDNFSGKPPAYRSDGDDYLLYSVGRNGIDDGGRGELFGAHADDIAIRTSKKEFTDDN